MKWYTFKQQTREIKTVKQIDTVAFVRFSDIAGIRPPRKLSQGHPYGILKRQHLGRNLFDVGCGNSSRKEAQERDYLRSNRSRKIEIQLVSITAVVSYLC
ncbi:Hypothetical predicted protein [Octopus vulgaris]|uniref:Uncharacterized protein n=1 Tax=Octopus vulgaris TaxID=6645 RepID=A0AA36BI71_OCTVU|nr:Hypothetical predicted protein [Octopus vulgaris]